MTFVKAWALGNDNQWHVYETEGEDFEWLADGYSACEKQAYRVTGVKKEPKPDAGMRQTICPMCSQDQHVSVSPEHKTAEGK